MREKIQGSRRFNVDGRAFICQFSRTQFLVKTKLEGIGTALRIIELPPHIAKWKKKKALYSSLPPKMAKELIKVTRPFTAVGE